MQYIYHYTFYIIYTRICTHLDFIYEIIIKKNIEQLIP